MSKSKSDKLDDIIRTIGSSVIAFSGGVDSSFLAYRASGLNQNNVHAVTVKTTYIPGSEIEDAIHFTRKYNIRHTVIDVDFPEIIRNNPKDRCYLCKKTLFSKINEFARSNNILNIVDGSNVDDTGEFRPGMKALREMGVRSPLIEAGLTKTEIRNLCREAGLDIWDKPAMACLLTRIPYNTSISEKTLRMIEAGEAMLLEKGFPGARVRVHGDVARIECIPGFMEKIIRNPAREEIISGMKKIGFSYISLDLEGYRTGSFNNEKLIT